MQKRRDLFQYIRSKKYNIACLQDVHIDNNMFSHVKQSGVTTLFSVQNRVFMQAGGGYDINK